MDSDQISEGGRANWKNIDMLKFFLESCVREVSQNGRQGGSLKMDSWERVRVALETAFRFKMTQRQLKNHYDYMKEKYQAWVPLTTKTGNIYNPEIHAITMTPVEWEDYIKIHPKARSLRSAPLPFPELCRALFEGTAATGRSAWGPMSSRPRPVPTSQIDVDVEIHVINDFEESLPDASQPSPGVDQSVASTTRVEGARKRKKKSRPEAEDHLSKWISLILESSKEHNAKFTETSKEQTANFTAALAAVVDRIHAPAPAPAPPMHASIKECVEKLNRVGWPERSTLHVAALGIFAMLGDHRDVWMCMSEDPSALQAWVMAIGGILGFKF